MILTAVATRADGTIRPYAIAVEALPMLICHEPIHSSHELRVTYICQSTSPCGCQSIVDAWSQERGPTHNQSIPERGSEERDFDRFAHFRMSRSDVVPCRTLHLLSFRFVISGRHGGYMVLWCVRAPPSFCSHAFIQYTKSLLISERRGVVGDRCRPALGCG
jgi:hypothetical protein